MKLNLLPLALAVAGSVCIPSLTTACILEIEIPLAIPEPALLPATLEIRVPRWDPQRFARSFGAPFQCACRGIGFQMPALPPQPDPLAPLVAAFREAKCAEAWRMERSFGGPSNLPRHRDRAIFESIKIEDEDLLLELFTLAAEAVAQMHDDEELPPPLYYESPTLAEAIAELEFVPEFVVTFPGAVTTRVEFDFSSKRALVESEDKFGFYPLDSVAVKSLSTFAESLTSVAF